ncbi:RHS repeat-associated core domain-containing protein [Niabella drilacis]|uniref:RHS repeat-associated core domain-containing protein n=1 Tax=Niabella drilacis (strain DSM 25811 / CCM 8410 / CCUG 62505 / LMG 26954 / E90) TaxID=1285928 RepID=UPI000B85C217|nr:RHS repeat-associated core domain-containing protein [Niabella drilacis]
MSVSLRWNENGSLLSENDSNIISYNILNLPKQVSVTGKGTISYQYDAAGTKLSKTVNETGQPQKVTTYLDGLIFENDVLQHIAMEEGRIRPNGSSFVYDYFLKDHLGNVRMMIDESGNLLEETHYYPFGLSMKGISYQNSSVVRNRIKFNGYEEQKNEFSDGSGLNWYDYKNRFYDNQLGRFFCVDRLAEKFPYYTPYQFAGNEPTVAIDLDGLEPLYIIDSKNPTDYSKKENRQAAKQALLKYLSATDANDAAVLATMGTRGSNNAINIDGTPATGIDKGFAIVGVAIPFVSGSALKSVWKAIKLGAEGTQLLEKIAAKVGRISTALDEKHITAAVNDILGKPVVINGKVYDHLKEVDNALTGVGNQLVELNKVIDSGDLGKDALKAAQDMRSQLQKQKDSITDILNRAREKAKELENGH